MPGWELINNKEKRELNSIFEKSNGVMFAHAFEKEEIIFLESESLKKL